MNTPNLLKPNVSYLYIIVGIILILADLIVFVPNTITNWGDYTDFGQKAVVWFEILFSAAGLALILFGLVHNVGDESLQY